MKARKRLSEEDEDEDEDEEEEEEEEKHLKIRKSRCIHRYFGDPINLLHQHGHDNPKYTLTDNHGVVYLDVKTRIGVRNETYHLLAGSQCDFVIIYNSCVYSTPCYTCVSDNNYVVYIVLKDLENELCRKTLTMEHEYFSCIHDRSTNSLKKAVDNAIFHCKRGILKVPYEFK